MQIAKLTNSDVAYIKLLGGEPLLHPIIDEIIYTTREKFLKSPIIIITNGILLPEMEESFWESCRRNNVIIEVTKYPINLDYNNFLDIVHKNNVKYRYRGNSENEEKKFWHIRLDLEGEQDAKESFISCKWGNGAICLADGKLYTCVIPAYIRHFNSYYSANLKITEKDYVDIYKCDSEKDILKALCQVPEFCKYCTMDEGNIKYNMNYGHSNKNIDEWT